MKKKKYKKFYVNLKINKLKVKLVFIHRLHNNAFSFIIIFIK